jgi:hypothetical protein
VDLAECSGHRVLAVVVDHALPVDVEHRAVVGARREAVLTRGLDLDQPAEARSRVVLAVRDALEEARRDRGAHRHSASKSAVSPEKSAS